MDPPRKNSTWQRKSFLHCAGRIPASEEKKDQIFREYLYGPYEGVKAPDQPAPWM